MVLGEKDEQARGRLPMFQRRPPAAPVVAPRAALEAVRSTTQASPYALAAQFGNEPSYSVQIGTPAAAVRFAPPKDDDDLNVPPALESEISALSALFNPSAPDGGETASKRAKVGAASAPPTVTSPPPVQASPPATAAAAAPSPTAPPAPARPAQGAQTPTRGVPVSAAPTHAVGRALDNVAPRACYFCHQFTHQYAQCPIAAQGIPSYKIGKPCRKCGVPPQRGDRILLVRFGAHTGDWLHEPCAFAEARAHGLMP